MLDSRLLIGQTLDAGIEVDPIPAYCHVVAVVISQYDNII